jgi:hypothetical protein
MVGIQPERLVVIVDRLAVATLALIGDSALVVGGDVIWFELNGLAKIADRLVVVYVGSNRRLRDCNRPGHCWDST